MRRSEFLTRIVSLFLVLVMLGGSVQWKYIVDAAVMVLTEAPIFAITFKDPDPSVTQAGDGFIYLMSSAGGDFPVLFEPDMSEGEMQDVAVTIQLPYLSYNNGVLELTYDQPTSMGIEAALVPDDNWSIVEEGQEADVVSVDGNQYHRGTIVVKRNRVTAAADFHLQLRFFGDVPENASATVLLGATYGSYKSSDGTVIENEYVVAPGSDSGGKGQVRKINLVNSNLRWEKWIDVVHTPVMWDKYNYMIYDVKVQNISEDASSLIDHFSLNLNVQSKAANPGLGGVLEEDMMKWEVTEEGQIVANQNPNGVDRNKNFIGVPGEGGALIYDVTGIAPEDRAKWNLEEFKGDNLPAPLPYIYSQAGVIGLNVGEESGGKLSPNEYKEYYIAVPYTNNYASDLSNKTTLRPTIYFGGRDLAWTKEVSNTSSFVQKKHSVEYRQYVLEDETNKEINEKDVALGTEQSFYLAGFKNTGNVPAFNGSITDVLPEDYQLQSLDFILDKNNETSEPSLDMWYRMSEDRKEDFLYFLFLDDSGEEQEIAATTLGISGAAAEDEKGNPYWSYEVKAPVEKWIKEHPGWSFAGKFTIYFKERIEAGEGLPGRIRINGRVELLKDYVNTLCPYYEHKYWNTIGNTDIPIGYVTEKQMPEASHVTLHPISAGPLMETHGVWRDDESDRVGKANEFQIVPASVDRTGLRYVLGNDSVSYIYHGQLTVDKLLSQKVSVTGILLNNKLLESAEIDSVVLTNASGKHVEIAREDFPVADEKGDILLPANLWTEQETEKGGLFGNPEMIEVKFQSFQPEISLDKGAYVQINGVPEVAGLIEIPGKWSTGYGIDDVEEDSVEVSAKIDVLNIDLSVTATALYGDQEHQSIEDVPYKEKAGYHFIVENKSPSPVGRANVDIRLDSVSDKNKGISDNTVVKGFQADTFTLAAGYEKTGDIQGVEVYDWNQEPGKDTASAKWSLKELEELYRQPDGSIQIPVGSLNELQWTRTIRIVYKEFNGDIQKDSADGGEDTALHISVEGTTLWTGELKATALAIPLNSIYTEDDIKSGDAILKVEQSVMSLHAHVLYDNLEESSERDTANTDGNRGTLGIPYDRDFTYRTEIINESDSVLDYVKVQLTLPLAKEGKNITGFHASGMAVYQDLIDQYGTFESMTLYDIDDPEGVVLTYDEAKGEFRTGLLENFQAADGIFSFDSNALKNLGIENLMKVELTGGSVVKAGDSAGQRYIDFYGFDDAEFGSSQKIEVEAFHYPYDFEDVEEFEFKSVDTAEAYISKMYFDTMISAGYNDRNPQTKYSAVSTPLEHVRNYPRSGDNSELDIGYKALGSYMVDFRQYLNTGGNLPDNNTTRQEHGSMSYIHPESFNTAAEVTMDVQLPSDHFETYYMKVNPKVKDYIQSITVHRKDGTFYTIQGGEVQYEAVEKTAEDEGYARLNLLQPSADTLFSGENEAFYREPSSYEGKEPDNPVVSVSISLSINQEQNRVSDGKVTANTPDYGTWYNAGNEATKYMFEFTGRFYRLAGAQASVSTTMKVGSDRAMERTVSGSAGNDKTNWSFQNYYKYGIYNDIERPYSAGHLYSRAMAYVVRDFNRVMKGATTSTGRETNYEADFGQDNQYVISFYRNSRCDVYGFDDGYSYAYEGTGKEGDWYGQDPDDWRGKISYADEVILRDALPVIKPDKTYNYYGFLTTGLKLEDSIGKYLDYIDLTVENVDMQGVKTNKQILRVPANLLKKDGSQCVLDFSYPEKSDGNEAGNEKGTEETVYGLKKQEYPIYTLQGLANGNNPEVSEGNVAFGEDQFVTSFEVHLKDMMGNGEYDKESGVNEIPDFNGGSGNIDLTVCGKPYLIYTTNPEKDGTNTVTPVTKEDYLPQTETTNPMNNDRYSPHYDSAVIMGYLIDFYVGYRVEAQGERNITDYHQKDNNTPTVASYGVEIYNQYREGNPTGMNAVAKIDTAGTTNTMNDFYNLQKIYIPKVFLDGNWFGAKNLQLTINGAAHIVDLTQKESAYISSGIKDNVQCYVVDVEQYIRQNKLTTAYSSYLTDGMEYVKAHVDKFTLDFEAISPDREKPETVVANGEYLTPDKEKGYTYWYEGVYVDRNETDFTRGVWSDDSTPSFGKVPNRFSPYNDSGNRDSAERVYNKVDVKMTSIDPNANIYRNIYTVNVQKQDYFSLKNLVATMVTALNRETTLSAGSTKTFAYDKDMNQKPELAVDNQHLLPYDYVEYVISAGAKENSLINLERPYINFQVPKGQVLVSWTIEDNTTNIPNETIKAVMFKDGGTTEKEVLPDIDYSLTETGEEEYFRLLKVTVGNKGNQISPGKSVKIRVVTQLTDEEVNKDKSFEGNANIRADAWVTADHKHAYPQYCIEDRSTTSTVGNYKTDRSEVLEQDKTGTYEIAYERNYSNTNGALQPTVYESRMISKLTLKDNGKVKVAYKFDDIGYEYHEQSAKLNVSDIRNDTRHYANEMTVTVSLLDKDKFRGFTLTKEPAIKYPENIGAPTAEEPTAESEEGDQTGNAGDGSSEDAIDGGNGEATGDVTVPVENTEPITDDSSTGGITQDSASGGAEAPQEEPVRERAPVKIEYRCQGEEVWKELPDTNQTGFLRTVEEIRWTYYDIPAYTADNEEIIFPEVDLIGVGRYEDIRNQSDDISMAEKYLANVQGKVEHVHQNYEIKAVGDPKIVEPEPETNGQENGAADPVTEENRDEILLDTASNESETKIEDPDSLPKESSPVEEEPVEEVKVQAVATLSKKVVLKETELIEKNVFRENPQVQFYTQVFDIEDEAKQDHSTDLKQKTGYRPGETMWQKVTLVNQHMVDGSGQQINDQGVLLNPVIYDKLPEYLSSDVLNSNPNQIRVRWTDIKGNKKTGLTLSVEKGNTVKGYDYGGDMVYDKSSAGTTGNGRYKAFDDLKPDDQNTSEIDFQVYTISLTQSGQTNVRIEVGDTLELWYPVTARENDLPMVYVDEDRSADTDNDRHPSYFPRAGEYFQRGDDSRGDGEAYPFSDSGNDGARHIDNQNRMMDMDYLLHDIGLSGTRNEQVDRWEYLDGSETLIPGCSRNRESYYYSPDVYGNNDVLIDEDASVLNNHQLVKYSAITDDKSKQGNALPTDMQYLSGGANRDWYRFVLQRRTKLGQNWGNETEDDKRVILWSQTRVHLQKAWLAVTSEMQGANCQYEASKGDGTDYPSNPKYYSNSYSSSDTIYNRRTFTDDNRITALEYNEKFITQLQAVNYGDWDLDGVEFVYTMPRGIEPVLNGEQKIDNITGNVLASVAETGNETYTPIEAENIEVEILQSPNAQGDEYLAPIQPQDPLWRDEKKDDYYPAEDGTVDTRPWVLKITVKKPLGKWFNRGAASGYKIKLDIPSHVYSTNENEHWYDRVLAKPYISADNANHCYYQIYDINHWEGSTKNKMQHNQIYGMDYMLYYDTSYVTDTKYSNGSPNMPYINGYNVQDNEVRVTDGNIMGILTENNYESYALADKKDLYAQSGTRAVMRKPFLRMWATSGEDISGKTRSQYYVNTEGERNQINIHVENKFWLDTYSPNRESYYDYAYNKNRNNYEVNGGSKGSLALPVITNILPYGIVPVDKEGKRFTEDNAENKKKELDWEISDYDYQKKSYSANENEKDFYETKVTYEEILAYDKAGKSTGEKEGRYVVTISAEGKGLGKDPVEEEARIKSDETKVFSFATFTYDLPKTETKEGVKEELYRNYEDNRTYLSSKIKGFKYLKDEKTSESDYTVGSDGQYRYATSSIHSGMPDERADAVIKEYSYGNYGKYSKGVIPNDELINSLETEKIRLFGTLRDYKEMDQINVEDYTGEGNSLRDNLFLSRASSDTPGQQDFNGNKKNTHVDYRESDEIPDIGVWNTMKLRTRAPYLSAETRVSKMREDEGYSKTDEEKKTEAEKEEIQKELESEYSDTVWYGCKVTNESPDADDFYKQGDIHHGKIVIAFHLPECVSYSGTADWNVENNDKNHYNNIDDFYLEYYNGETKSTEKLTQKELRDKGWGIQVIEDSSDTWKKLDYDHDPQIVTFEITTPKSEKFSDYASYVEGEHPSGYLATGSSINFKIKTRVDRLNNLDVMESPDLWTGFYSTAYATVHDGDGKYALADDGTFISEANKDQVQENNYNGYEINFAEQPPESYYWNEDQTVSDLAAEESDGKLEQDYDIDGELDLKYVYSSSYRSDIRKPAATVRIDTSKPRRQANNPDAEMAIMEDAHVKSAFDMKIYLDQAVNERAAVNAFLVNYNVPYYGTDTGTSNPADSSNGKLLKQKISKINTGVWMVPDELGEVRKKELEERLRVFLYVLKSSKPESESGYYNPQYGNVDAWEPKAEWVSYGKPDGYSIKANSEIAVKEDDKFNIYQIRWVIRADGFTDENNVEYTDEQAAIYYPVPKGFRLDVDANSAEEGKQEMDEVDPQRQNRETLPDDIAKNCAGITVNTLPEVDDGINKHNNHFISAFPKIDDFKYAQISERARAGYYVDPQLPILNIDISTYYFGGGENNGYSWQDKFFIDTGSSKMIKYAVVYENVGKDRLTEQYTEDILTNPNITLVLPYMEQLNEKSLQYIEYQEPNEDGSCSEDYYIGNAYGGKDVKKNLDDKAPLWTWHFVNIKQETVPIEDAVADIQKWKAPEAPSFTVKPPTLTSTIDRKILNFNFEGQLNPGYSIVIECMVPLQEGDGGTVSEELLEAKAYGFKSGGFIPYVENSEEAKDSLGYEYDTRDVNENGNSLDLGVTRSASALGFATMQRIEQNKTVSTELETYRSKVPAAVNEGGNYTFYASSRNKSDNTDYKLPVIYDVLPYAGDHHVTKIDPRESVWNGWLIPKSVKMTEYKGSKSHILNPNDYEIWVGPLKESANGQIQVLDMKDLPDPASFKEKATYAGLLHNSAAKSQYFVLLSDIENIADKNQREVLLKEIRTIWAEVKNKEYQIGPQCRLELSYEMHEPLNVPKKYIGTVAEAKDEAEKTALIAKLKEYTGWNTFASHVDGENNPVIEQAKAGVYVNAPAGRGYLGCYIWEDADYSGKPDGGEGIYGKDAATGRIQLKEKTTDLNFDGTLDDPGVDGVLVELLTVNGHPCNRDGEPVGIDENTGKYIVLEDKSGQPIVDVTSGVYQYTRNGPVTYVTEKDYYGNAGYFMLSNLKPGDYNLRYTFPENYNEYSVTTLGLNNKTTPIAVFRDGKEVYNGTDSPITEGTDTIPKDRLVVQTAEPVQIEEVDEEHPDDYDSKMTSYNLGIGRGYIYGGYTWLDETKTEKDGEKHIESNGYMEESEDKLSDIQVSIYDINDMKKPVLDGDGNPAVYTVKNEDNGYFQFRLAPGRQYVAVAEDVAKSERLLKPTPWTFTNNPLEKGNDNDLSKADAIYSTKAFQPEIPRDESGNISYENKKNQTFKINKNIGLGLINAGRGYLGKFVWEDTNYDGIQNPTEPGIQGVTVTLKRYYYDPKANKGAGEWLSQGDDKTQVTNPAGAYVFDNVYSYYVKPDEKDEKYLAGYKLFIEDNKNGEILKRYGATHLLANKGIQDSDYNVTTGDFSKDYIILAEKAGDNTPPDKVKEYGDEKYDISDAEIILDYDAGLVPYEYSEVAGIIWNDGASAAETGYNYNGLLDEGEKGYENVTVYLEAYYRDADGNYQLVPNTGALKADGTVCKTEETVTDSNGNYLFEKVPAFVTINKERYLCYYRIRADVPDKCGVTRYKQNGGEKKNSSWITDQTWEDIQYPTGNYLTAPTDGDFFTLAKPIAEDKKNDPYTITQDGQAYDIITNRSIDVSYDGGLIEYPQGSIKGFVWEDTDYNGIRNTDATNGEPGVEGVKLTLRRYYYKDNAWLEDTAYTAKPVEDRTVITGADGSYLFKELDTQVFLDGKHYLAGYQIQMEELPENYGVTRYRQGDDITLDSDLRAEDLMLVTADEFIPVADIAAENLTGGGYNSSIVSAATRKDAQPQIYDLLTAVEAGGHDAGLRQYPDATLEGVIWNDSDYDGVRKEDEQGISGVKVQLFRYYYDSDDSEKLWKQESADPVATAVSDVDGKFIFDAEPGSAGDPKNIGLDTQVVKGGEIYLAGYKPVVSGIDDTIYGITLYHAGDNKALDSDLNAEESILQGDDYVIAAKAAEENPKGGFNKGSIVTYHRQDGTEITYDLLTAEKISGLDGGLVAYPKGTVAGRIWLDENYNGIQDEDEPGLQDVEVILRRGYYKDDIWNAENVPAGDAAGGLIKTAVSDSEGRYEFEDLDTRVMVDGEPCLAGYKMQLKDLPDWETGTGDETQKIKLAVTKYRRGEPDKDSDLRVQDLSLQQDNEYVVAAAEAEENKKNNSSVVEVSAVDGKNILYDMLTVPENPVSGQDGGLTPYQKGSLSGYIWEDEGYDGMRDAGDKGIADVGVTLRRYLHKDGAWVLDNSFSYPEGPQVTAADGSYIFDGLDTYVEDDTSKAKYLCSYKLQAELSTMPEGYAVTKYRVGQNSEINSDLIADSGELNGADEYLVLADKADDILPDEYRLEGYDIISGIHTGSIDGGITPYQPGSITGVIWDDSNYDGIRSDSEKGVKDVEITLTPYLLENNQWRTDESLASMSVKTDESGVYTFSELPTMLQKGNDRYLIGYKLQADTKTLPAGYNVTKYMAGDDVSRDSNLIKETGDLTEAEEYLILAEKAAEGSYDGYVVDGYDIVRGQDISGYDGGVMRYQQDTKCEPGSITGMIWEDTDYDGIRKDGDAGVKGIEITLTRYIQDGEKWLKDSEFQDKSTLTDEDGRYVFDELLPCSTSGRKRLYGYKVRVTDGPENLAVTKYKQCVNEQCDSNWIPETGELVEEEEYIVVAAPLKKNGANAGSYNLQKGIQISGYDGGVKEFERGVIRGSAWIDENEDGIMDDMEARIGALDIVLKGYVKDGNQWSEIPQLEQTVTTDSEGNYVIDNLELCREEKGQNSYPEYQLLGYRLTAKELPEDCEATSYYQNNGKFDSKLVEESLSLSDSVYELDGYLIPAQEAEECCNDIYEQDGFDIVIAREVSHMHAGLLKKLQKEEQEENKKPPIIKPISDNPQIDYPKPSNVQEIELLKPPVLLAKPSVSPRYSYNPPAPPKTGDDTVWELWLALMAIAGVTIVAVLKKRRRV